MNLEKKLIYSKRYPSLEALVEKAREEHPEDLPPEERPEETKAALDAFWKTRHHDQPPVPIPWRIETSQKVIALAKALSETYEIDTDIREAETHVEIDFHLPCAAYPIALSRKLGTLIAMCDQLSSFLSAGRPNGFTLSLDWITHEYQDSV